MPKVIHQETICCGYKRCPEVLVFDDGSATLTDVGTDGRAHTITLQRNQRTRLAELLALHVPEPQEDCP